MLELLVKEDPAVSDIVKLASKVELKRGSDAKIGLSLSADTISQFSGYSSIGNFTHLRDQLLPDDVIGKVTIPERHRKPNLFFELNQERFTKEVLQHHAATQPPPPCHKRVVVEFR